MAKWVLPVSAIMPCVLCRAVPYALRCQDGEEDLMADLDAEDLLQGEGEGEGEAEEDDDCAAYDVIRDPDYIPDPDMNPDVEGWIRMRREEAGA